MTEALHLPPESNPSMETFGIIVVGMAQAGKSTLGRIINEEVASMGLPGGNFMFPVSHGYRGFALEVLRHHGVDLDAPVAIHQEDYNEQVGAFLEQTPDVEQIITDGFRQPSSHDSVLRCRAVDSVIAWTGEYDGIATLVHEVGGEYLKGVLADPEGHGLARRPATVLMDARNRKECQEKFTTANVTEALAIVLECPETEAARRVLRRSRKSMGQKQYAEALSTMAQSLRDRNARDRQRQIGNLTLSQDIAEPAYLHDLLRVHGDHFLAEAGHLLAGKPEAALIINTSQVTLEQERRGIGTILPSVLRTLTAAQLEKS